MTIIGISCGFNGTKEENINLNKNYIKVVKEFKATPVLLPPQLENKELDNFKNILDGIILSGGGDIDPLFFGEDPDYNMRRIDPVRDKFEIELTNWALAENVPLFAICRGLQILNISCGGSIIQHLDEGKIKHTQNAPRWYATHRINIIENTIFTDIFKTKEIKVNSFHHQAIKDIGDKLEILAIAGDDIIEGAVVKNHPFALGVQWHPESMYNHYPDQKDLFSEFFKKCNE